jgi:hypothetical protein
MEVSVDSRVIINATFFRKINSNYSRLKITDIVLVLDLWDLVELGGDSQENKWEEMINNDFLICCSTVLGFSFADRL